MGIDLTMCSKEYHLIQPLTRGNVSPDGVDLTVVDGYSSPERFTRLLEYELFDVGELSMGSYLASQEHPDRYSVSAIPVFPHRRFRHSFLYKRRGSDIETPRDLNGGSIALPNWQTTTGVWVRGILGERHGVDLESISWQIPGSEIVPLSMSDRFDLVQVDKEYSGSTITYMEQMLAEGEVDAVISPTEYRDDRVERVFDEPFRTEQTYYEDTGHFPIMHTVVIKDEVLEREPWVAAKLQGAFTEALDVVMDEVNSPGWFKETPFVWGLESIERQLDAMGENPWEYGFTEENVSTLNKLINYAYDQELISTRYDVEELFVQSVDVDRFGG